MGRVHEVLRWANRRAVAEEITRRGYRVSGETLNRWVRDEKEFPAVVERIVFELFGITEHNQTAPPWAERLERKVDGIYERGPEIAEAAVRGLIEALAPADLQQAAQRVIERLEALPPPADEAPAATDASGGPDAGEQPAPESGSRRTRTAEDH